MDDESKGSIELILSDYVWDLPGRREGWGRMRSIGGIGRTTSLLPGRTRAPSFSRVSFVTFRRSFNREMPEGFPHLIIITSTLLGQAPEGCLGTWKPMLARGSIPALLHIECRFTWSGP
jgi:hypothetical protein